MAANYKRTAFHPSGPFLAKKNFSVYETNLAVGKVYAADVFAALHERRVELLFNAGYIDMAPADAKALGAADVGGAHPLDRDGDGSPGGSLTDAEKDALQQAGLSLEDWLALPEPERTAALASAMQGAPASSPAGDTGGTGGNPGGDDGEGGQNANAGPETGAAGDAAAAARVDGQQAPEGAEIAAYKHFGFGRWFAVDKDGNQIGKKVSKTEAEQFAALHRVPIQGILA